MATQACRLSRVRVVCLTTSVVKRGHRYRMLRMMKEPTRHAQSSKSEYLRSMSNTNHTIYATRISLWVYSGL
jgi:hypothetical protein